MKKLDTLKHKNLKPKQETVNFLLNFSKSLAIMKVKEKRFIISKN